MHLYYTRTLRLCSNSTLLSFYVRSSWVQKLQMKFRSLTCKRIKKIDYEQITYSNINLHVV